MSFSDIQHTLNRLAWGTDRRDIDLIRDSYTEDLRWARADQNGNEDLVLESRQAVLTRLESVWEKAPRPNGKHLISNVIVDWRSDGEAAVRSYKTVVQVIEGKPVVANSGWYDDVFVNDGGTWRVRSRVLYTDGKL